MKKRVRSLAFVATVVASVGLVAPAFAASSGTATTTLGQTMTASITTPTDQQHFPIGTGVTVTGQVSLTGGTQVIPTNVTYVLDVSGSTSDPCKPFDASDTRTVLKCEQQGAIALNNSIAASPSTESAVISFSDTATVEQPFVASNSPLINSAINSLVPTFTTNYDAALQALADLYTVGPPIVPNTNRKVAFFLSDGVPNPGDFTTGPGSPLAAVVAAGITVNTYSVGDFAARCDDAGSDLKTIASQTGGVCNDVADPSQLAANLSNARVDVRMNGKAFVPATLNGNTWSITFPNGTSNVPSAIASNPVVLGNNPIVARVTAPDGTTFDLNITIIGDPPPTTTTTVVPIPVVPTFTG